MRKKRSDEPQSVKAFAPPDPKAPTKLLVRYIGFESIDAGRRLRFRVKPNGREFVEVTFDVPDAPFITTSGISIQDAAPMAYEKLVDLLATESAFNSETLCLTDEDIAQYLQRHLSSQKRAYSIDHEQRDVAA